MDEVQSPIGIAEYDDNWRPTVIAAANASRSSWFALSYYFTFTLREHLYTENSIRYAKNTFKFIRKRREEKIVKIVKIEGLANV